MYFTKIYFPAWLAAVSMLMSNPGARANEQYPASMASGTLPVVYINTENTAPVVDKINAIPAGLYVDPMNASQYDPVGSPEEPIVLTIRGRGNSTWQMPKKPYKLKFENKTSLLGLPKSKHFALLAYNGSQVWNSALTGFEISRRVGMPWTPNIVPVELVLNGEYEGVYFLIETIKIEPDRLNIFEQEDGETDPEIIPYGWLLEIDNNLDDYQHRFMEREDGTEIRFTFKAPEVLSEPQNAYITNELENINFLIYNSSLYYPVWTEYLDISSLVKYFICREMLHNYDGYSGSFYLHKDKVENAKWTFGPMWDFSCFTTNKDAYLLIDPKFPEWGEWHWMKKIMEYPAFTEAFKKEWTAFYSPEKMEDIISCMREPFAGLQPAFDANNRRWADVMPDDYYMNEQNSMYVVEAVLRNNSAWINAHQDIDALTVAGVETVDYNAAEGPERYFTIDGLELLARSTAPGIYILRKGDKATKMIL